MGFGRGVALAQPEIFVIDIGQVGIIQISDIGSIEIGQQLRCSKPGIDQNVESVTSKLFPVYIAGFLDDSGGYPKILFT